MMQKELVARPWADYELLDSGENMKLERFGEVVLSRPETQALWPKKNPALWDKADAEFTWGEKGKWKTRRPVPRPWKMEWNGARFFAKLTNFKHVGVFPEQEPNWEWLRARSAALAAPAVLNLFGYTGIASIVVAKAGAKVTHVDGSKQTIAWAKENSDANEYESGGVRYIWDDAMKFAKREEKRGNAYDGIIVDPPAFGRGAKGEVWKIERDLPELLRVSAALLSKKPGSFFLLNGYAAGYSSRAFSEAVEAAFGEKGEYGELLIAERAGDRAVPSGIYGRFVR